MMTRSIVGRFLIVAVLLVSLGVIAQAALIISKQPGKAVAKTRDAAPPVAVAAALPAPAASDGAASAAGDAAPAAASPAPDAGAVRVVYPGPLGDAPAPRKIADAAPASPPPAAPASMPAATAAPAPVAQAVPATPAVVSVAAAPRPSPVVVASAETDTQPTAEPADAAATKGGIDLNSASVEALNRLGGGHIGQAIVKHRPYHSVDELVKKRIVRRSVYDQIKDQVAAD